MKRILILAVCVLLSSTVMQAETVNTKIGDTTITTTATPAYTVSVAGAKTTVSFQYVITKTSGTVAGTIVLLGTLDGSNYATINTYTLTDATATTSLTYNYNGYVKYKVIVTQTNGTVSANFKIWTLYRG